MKELSESSSREFGSPADGIPVSITVRVETKDVKVDRKYVSSVTVTLCYTKAPGSKDSVLEHLFYYIPSLSVVQSVNNVNLNTSSFFSLFSHDVMEAIISRAGDGVSCATAHSLKWGDGKAFYEGLEKMWKWALSEIRRTGVLVQTAEMARKFVSNGGILDPQEVSRVWSEAVAEAIMSS